MLEWINLYFNMEQKLWALVLILAILKARLDFFPGKIDEMGLWMETPLILHNQKSFPWNPIFPWGPQEILFFMAPQELHFHKYNLHAMLAPLIGINIILLWGEMDWQPTFIALTRWGDFPGSQQYPLHNWTALICFLNSKHFLKILLKFCLQSKSH